jgi:Holliday junction resolvase RusA-like endonuclease
MTITFFVAGDPKPQPRQRHRAFMMGSQIVTQNYTPAGAPVNTWKDLIALTARDLLPASPLSGPLKVDATYRFRRPKSHFRTGKYSGELRADAPVYHTKKPDRDNLDKAFLDIMTQIRFWRDDCQVVAGEVKKVYAGPEERPGACFTISKLEDA